MEYLTSEELLKYFEKEIHEVSQKRIDELKAEINQIKQTELDKIDQDLKESIDHDLELELKDLKTDHSYEMNQLLTENAKELMNYRQVLFQSVFDEVKGKLSTFISSKEYVDLLTNKVKKLNTIFKKDNIIFFVKKDDKAIQSVIKNEFEGTYQIEPSESIQIGGFFARCEKKGIELDETLDSILESKKQWFYEKSNLFIKK